MAFLRALVAIAGTLATVTASAAQLYWIDEQGIHRSNLDASNQQLVVPSASHIPSMAADSVSGKLYWDTTEQDSFNRTIRVANLDGSNPNGLITGVEEPQGIAVDHTRGHVYYGAELSQEGYIFRSGLDGSNPQPWIHVQDNEELFIDEAAAKLYKLDRDDDFLSRMNLDGTDQQFIGDAIDGHAHAMAVDPPSASVYWTYALGVYRSNLDGSNAQKIWDLSVPGDYDGIAVDSANNRLYLANRNVNTIYQAALDGSGFAPLITGVAGVHELHIVQPIPEPSTLALLLVALPLAYLAYRRR